MKDELNRILNSTYGKDGIKLVFVDAFLTSILREKNASENDYLHTRILGKLLMNSVKDIDALVYPSIALEGAVNIAIKIEAVSRVLKLASSCLLKINKKYDHEIFDFIIVKSSNRQNSDGRIVWD